MMGGTLHGHHFLFDSLSLMHSVPRLPIYYKRERTFNCTQAVKGGILRAAPVTSLGSVIVARETIWSIRQRNRNSQIFSPFLNLEQREKKINLISTCSSYSSSFSPL
jgi:hypothetical protein